MKDAITRRVQMPASMVLAGLIAFAPPGLSASGDDLSLDEAVSRTLADNPELVAFGYQVEAQRGRLTQSGIKPAPEIAVEVENFLGTGAYSGVSAPETTLSLGWVLERGKRQHYIEAAQAGVSVLDAQAQIGRLEAVALTALLFLDNLEFQERLAMAEEAVAMAEQTVATVNSRVEAGRAPAAERARAEAAVAKARLIAEDMKHELSTARQRLAAQWSAPQPDFQRVTGNWRELPAPGSFASLLERVERSPRMASFLTRRRLREAELRVARIQARPDWRVSAGVRRLELADDYAFRVGLTVPLMPGDRNRGLVAEAQANVELVDAEQAATRVQIEAQLFAFYEGLKHGLHSAEILRDEVLPRLQEAAAQTRKGYEAGRYSYYELQQLQSELLSTRAGLVETAIDARRQMIEIERLTGTALPSTVQ